MDSQLDEELHRLEQAWDDKLAYAYRWLRKDGLETGFYEELAVRAPRVTLALAKSEGWFEYFEEYLEVRQIKDVRAGEERLNAIEQEPNATWRKSRSLIGEQEASLLESWIDRCANAELRLYGEKPTTSVGKRVRHVKFGSGTITALAGDNATVQFDGGVEKKLRMSFLEIES